MEVIVTIVGKLVYFTYPQDTLIGTIIHLLPTVVTKYHGHPHPSRDPGSPSENGVMQPKYYAF